MFNAVVNRDDLAASLEFICLAVDKRNTIPILRDVLLTCVATRLHLRATNLEQMAQDSIGLLPDDGQGGSICIPARMLLETLRGMPKGGLVQIVETKEAKLHAGGGLVAVRGQGALATLPTDCVEDYPGPMDDKEDKHGGFSALSEHVRPGLKQALHCVSLEETRYYLNGVHVTLDKGRLLFVSTDGHRLAVASSPAVPEGAIPDNVIVPTAGVRAILKLLAADDLMSWIVITRKTITVAVAARIITIRLIDGTYPSWERLLPGIDRTVEFERVATIKALETLAKVTEGIGAKFHFTGNNVAVGNDQFQAPPIKSNYARMPFTVSFNARYLAGLFRQLESDNVLMEMSLKAGPVSFRNSKGNATPYPVFLLMPLPI